MVKAESALEDTASHSQLSFVYNIHAMKILFASQPVAAFFGHDFDNINFIGTIPRDHSFNHEWQRSLLLRNGETHSFHYPGQSLAGSFFTFQVTAIQASLTTEEIILVCLVKKSSRTPQAPVGSVSPADYKKEYAEFIDLAVHDLEAPVRKLGVMVDKVAESVPPGSDAVPYLQRAERILGDMKAQLESLAKLAGLNTGNYQIIRCDLNTIVAALTAELQGTAPGGMNITSDPLPVVDGHFENLKLLFRQLLTNSIKFSRPDRKPEIRISYAEVGENEAPGLQARPGVRYHRISVTDNGIGFSPEMSHRIFRPFVRLNGKSEYPGQGMGLAIARKIAEMHNGVLYAEGHADGAVFILILPQSIH